MDRKKLLLFLLLSLGTLVYAQQADPSVVAPAGTSTTGAGITLDWTVGELLTQTRHSTEGMLTEGFHQPVLKVEEVLTAAPELEKSQIDVLVYPNPTQANLHITITAGPEGQGELALQALDGRLLRAETINLASGDHTWSLAAYPAGLYLISLKTKQGELLKSFKITKTY
jgi:hypothetical protein